MSHLYSAKNKIRFNDIPEKYATPRQYKAKLSDVHSEVVIYVNSNYSNTRKYRQKVVDAINYLTYCVIQNEPPSFAWVRSDPINTIPSDIDMELVESSLGDLLLTEDAIEWDVKPSDRFASTDDNVEPTKLPSSESTTMSGESRPVSTTSNKKIEAISTSVNTSVGRINRPLKDARTRNVVREVSDNNRNSSQSSMVLTSKEDLYIQPPKYPRFDVSKVWLKQVSGDDTLVIYTTLPEIPTKQNEISVTTNIGSMTDSEFMNLYPNHIIRTRSAKMYERIEGLGYDDDLGVIIPIAGFTENQVIDNIIQYPHFYKLRKIDENGMLSNFYKTIEINGCLHPIEEAWDSLPESKLMPKDPEFAKEYIVRRYLLEESLGIDHKFKLSGTLEPFLTLFMPPSNYSSRGYKDTLGIAKQCVKSRISYKQSRNPILRRLGKV